MDAGVYRVHCGTCAELSNLAKAVGPEGAGQLSEQAEVNIDQHAHGGRLTIGADSGFETPDLRG